MKNLVTLLTISTLLSCHSRRIEGVFYYTDVPKEKSDGLSTILDMGKGMGCAMIGTFEFKNGMCYTNILGTDYRTDYDIDDNIIYLKNNTLDQAGVGIRIIDHNTLSYSGCIFKRIDFSKLQPASTNGSVNLRSGPGTEYEKLETLEKGTEIYVLEDSKDWVKVRANWKEGYIHKNYVELSEKQ